jgi:hypothetical protein
MAMLMLLDYITTTVIVVVPNITVVHATIITGGATDIGLSSNRAHQKKGPGF